MPNAARERVASPRAGAALARAIRLCLPGRVRLGEVRSNVTKSVTKVNAAVTRNFVVLRCEQRSP
jgi:hypothetical protein